MRRLTLRISYAEKKDRFFRNGLLLAGLTILCLVIAIFLTLVIGSIPSFRATGIHFFWGKVWDPVTGVFGALPFLIGTLLTSFLALLISIPFSISIALFLGEYFPPGKGKNRLAGLVQEAVELIAGIPSVIYGFWGLFVLVPIVRNIETQWHVLPYGVGIFTASLILAIMIIPYAASLSREIISLVPDELKEAAYSLGATHWEVIRYIVLPYARTGIFAGILLSLGRALGETMAVTMVIGNTSAIPTSIFSPGNTLASVIANEFTEAANETYLSALIELGLVLFVVTTLIHLIGKRVIRQFSTT
ncbi:MAG: phosphate ABC transporter permease subunit PstC [Thermoflavifilum sp.]|nr:phosphate ABC transporter permease subunit PstC [Thermoflavifilum sp.]